MVRSFEDIVKGNVSTSRVRSFDEIIADQPTPVSRTPSKIKSFEDIAGVSRDDPIGFGEAFSEDPLSKIPFSPVGPLVTLDLLGSAKRLQKESYNKAPIFSSFGFKGEMKQSTLAGGALAGLIRTPKGWTPEAQRQHDLDVVSNFVIEQDEKAQRGYTTMGRVGQITSEMPSFVIEFLATGGLKKLGSEAAKKAATRLLRKSATTTAGKIAVAGSGFAAGAALRAAGMPHRAANAILKRRVPKDININDDGTVNITGSGEGEFTSVVKGLTDHYIEIASEQVGEHLTPFLHHGISKLPFIGKVINKVGNKWVSNKIGRTSKEFAKKVSTKTGFNGVLEEIGEEFLGDSVRGILDIDDFGAGKDSNPLTRLGAAVKQDVENVPAMLIAFGAFGATRRGASTGVAAVDQAIQRQADENKKRIDLVNKLNQEELIPTMIETAEGSIGFEDDSLSEKVEQIQKESPNTFDKPGFFSILTPKWLLNRKMGVETLLEDVDSAWLASSLEQKHLNSWVNRITKKLKKEKNLTRLPGILEEKAEQEAKELFEDKDFLSDNFDTIPDKFEDVQEQLIEKTKAHILQTKLDSDNPSHIMRDLLDTYTDAPDFLNEGETKIFNEVRELTRNLLTRANKAREARGAEPIRDVGAYITHWTDRIAERIIQKDPAIRTGYMARLMGQIPKELKNPTAEKRRVRGELEKHFSKDLEKLLRVMVSFDLRDIHLANPVANAFEELEDLRRKRYIPESTFKEVENYLNYDILKHQTPLDKKFNRTLQGPADFLNSLKIFKKGIDDPSYSVFANLRRLGHIAGLGFRLKSPLRNLGQRLLLLDLYRTSDYAKAQATVTNVKKMPIVDHPITGEPISVLALVREQDWYKETLGRFEDVVGVSNKIEDAALHLYSKSHVGNQYISNVEVSAMTGYYDWLTNYEQSHNPQSKMYKHLVEMSKKTGIPLIQLQTQKEDMLWNIREAVRRTQWEYFSISMPVAFRGQVSRAGLQFQSWWMNYYFNHCREIGNQVFTGRNSLGRGLSKYGRYRAFKGMGTIVAMGRVAETLLGIEVLKFLVTPLPQGWPPIPAFIISVFNYLRASDDQERKRAWKHLKRNLKFWIPFSSSYRDMNKVLSGESDISELILYKKQK